MTEPLDTVGLDQERRTGGRHGLPIWSAGEYHGVAVRKLRELLGAAEQSDQNGCQRAIREGLEMLEDRGVLTMEEVELLRTAVAGADAGSPDVLERVRRLHDQLTLGRETSPLALTLTSLAVQLDRRNLQRTFGAAVAGAVTGVHLGDGVSRPVEGAITGAIAGSVVAAGLPARQ